MSGPKYRFDIGQGSLEWLQARCGMLTSSNVPLVITPTLKVASNDKERLHLHELLAQRVTGHVEEGFTSWKMARGKEDEIIARDLYSANYEPVTECGFVTNSWPLPGDGAGVGDHTIGFSPDGLVGEDGFIECKSRDPKFQVQTITDDEVPVEYRIQIQTGLLVTQRQWCDFVSYSGGLPMAVMRVLPDPVVQAAILEATGAFETRLQAKLAVYRAIIGSGRYKVLDTVRRDPEGEEIQL